MIFISSDFHNKSFLIFSTLLSKHTILNNKACSTYVSTYVVTIDHSNQYSGFRSIIGTISGFLRLKIISHIENNKDQ